MNCITYNCELLKGLGMNMLITHLHKKDKETNYDLGGMKTLERYLQ